MSQVAEIHKLDDDFEVRRLARLIVTPGSGVEVVELAPGGAGVARLMLGEMLVDPFGRTVSAADGADFLKTLRWARSSDRLWVTPLAELPEGQARDPEADLPGFADPTAPATVPYPEPPPGLDGVRVAEVRWPAPDDYVRTEVVARLVAGPDGQVQVEPAESSGPELELVRRAIEGRSMAELEDAVIAPGMAVIPAPFDSPGDRAWRNGIVQARREAIARGQQEAIHRLDLEFATRLPRIWLSRCPFTQEVLRWAIDPWGFDSPYWDAGAPVRPLDDELPPTFLGLAGAVVEADTSDGIPADALGPGRPPLFPAVAGDDGVRAVLSATRVGRYRCDVVAYFAQPRPGGPPSFREWGTWFARVRQGHGWRFVPGPAQDPPIETDLASWIRSGHLSWVKPSDMGVELRSGSDDCPWLTGDES